MFAVPQRLFGLLIDGAGGRYPQRQAGLPVEALQGGGGQQRFAAAGGYLEADMGDGASGAVGSLHILAGWVGHIAGFGQRLPGMARMVAQLGGNFHPGLLQCGYAGFRLDPRRFQGVQPPGKGVQYLVLVLLQFQRYAPCPASPR